MSARSQKNTPPHHASSHTPLIRLVTDPFTSNFTFTAPSLVDLHVLLPRAALDVVVVEDDADLVVARVWQAVRHYVSCHVMVDLT